jgi:hypothetical protein
MVKLPRLSAPIDLVSYPTATPVTLRRSASLALPLRRFRKPIHLGPSDEALLPVSMLVLHSLKAAQRRRSKLYSPDANAVPMRLNQQNGLIW